ncbi:Phosphoribosylformylglycinamidine cyclo-ligase [Candidatus Gugararchaeum adminiculabundum]|nr:Phosphoribosylformylglycinamidine cyclo-ligase [Candidatus Gugararchaeum adminiculabundum]
MSGETDFSYAKAGVNVATIRQMQKKINKSIASTKNEFSMPVYGHYAGMFKAGKNTLAVHCDGVGSKVLVAQELGKYDTVGIDAIAMNVNDMVCIGAQPAVCVDYIALERQDDVLVSELMKGLIKGAKYSNCAIVGGETAIMPDVIKGIQDKTGFDLAVTCVGFVKGRLITGKDLRKGDVLVGLEASGIHSNGYTLARRLLPADEWGEKMLTPTRIYVKQVLEMIGKTNVHGIAHITGGAFSKLTRIGRQARVGFVLDSMPRAPEIFQEMGRKVNDEREMYRTFNMGVGMVIAVDKNEAETIIGIARKNGTRASVIGEVVPKQGVILEKQGKKIRLT